MIVKKKNNEYKFFLKKIIEKKYKKNIFNYRGGGGTINKIKNIKNILEIFSGDGLISYKIFKKEKIKFINIIDISYCSLKKSIKIFKKKIKIIKKNIIKNFKKKKFDLLIINPPYISYKNKNIKTKIKFEPIESLTDFKNGYYFYKKIKNNLNFYLKSFKYFLFEIFNKKKNIKKIIKGFVKIK